MVIRSIWHFVISGLCLPVAVTLFFVYCGDNPYSPDKTPTHIPVTYSISRVNNTLNAYVHFPITFCVNISEHNKHYVDSIFVRSAGLVPFERLDASYCTEFSYVSAGIHEATVRFYFSTDRGLRQDTVIMLTTAWDYSGLPVDMILEYGDYRVALRAVGVKWENAHWHWDLSRVGLCTVTSSGDTSILVNRAVDDTVFLSQISGGVRSVPAVPIPFRVVFRDSIDSISLAGN